MRKRVRLQSVPSFKKVDVQVFRSVGILLSKEVYTLTHESLKGERIELIRIKNLHHNVVFELTRRNIFEVLKPPHIRSASYLISMVWNWFSSPDKKDSRFPIPTRVGYLFVNSSGKKFTKSDNPNDNMCLYLSIPPSTEFNLSMKFVARLYFPEIHALSDALLLNIMKFLPLSFIFKSWVRVSRKTYHLSNYQDQMWKHYTSIHLGQKFEGVPQNYGTYKEYFTKQINQNENWLLLMERNSFYQSMSVGEVKGNRFCCKVSQRRNAYQTIGGYTTSIINPSPKTLRERFIPRSLKPGLWKWTLQFHYEPLNPNRRSMNGREMLEGKMENLERNTILGLIFYDKDHFRHPHMFVHQISSVVKRIGYPSSLNHSFSFGFSLLHPHENGRFCQDISDFCLDRGPRNVTDPCKFSISLELFVFDHEVEYGGGEKSFYEGVLSVVIDSKRSSVIQNKIRIPKNYLVTLGASIKLGGQVVTFNRHSYKPLSANMMSVPDPSFYDTLLKDTMKEVIFVTRRSKNLFFAPKLVNNFIVIHQADKKTAWSEANIPAQTLTGQPVPSIFLPQRLCMYGTYVFTFKVAILQIRNYTRSDEMGYIGFVSPCRKDEKDGFVSISSESTQLVRIISPPVAPSQYHANIITARIHTNVNNRVWAEIGVLNGDELRVEYTLRGREEKADPRRRLPPSERRDTSCDLKIFRNNVVCFLEVGFGRQDFLGNYRNLCLVLKSSRFRVAVSGFSFRM